jgi:hypothetical protein
VLKALAFKGLSKNRNRADSFTKGFMMSLPKPPTALQPRHYVLRQHGHPARVQLQDASRGVAKRGLRSHRKITEVLLDAPVKAIGIADLSLIQRHFINRVFGSVSHVIHFQGGGVLRYAYNEKNEIIELSAIRMKATKNEEGALVFDVLLEDS